MRLWQFLRSRRLAVWLLVGLTSYMGLSTVIPLSQPFSNPVFLAVSALVTFSTAACAWERSVGAVRSWRRARANSLATAADAGQPSSVLVIELPAHLSTPDALSAADDALRGLRMRAREVGDGLLATSGQLGLLGSPLFHWAMVGLFVFAALGQLTRYEGVAEVPLGESFSDVAESYESELSVGPLAGDSFSGDQITFGEMDFDLVVDDVSRGTSPWVVLSRGGEVVVEQWVYPNNPLRDGSMLIHHVEIDPLLLATVRFGETAGEQRVAVHFEFEQREAKLFDATDPVSGEAMSIRVVPLGGEKVEVSAVEVSDAQTSTVGQGEVALLGDGATFTPDALTYSTQLRVVRDWSVPWVYAMFLLGCVGVALTVFVLPRSVTVGVAGGENGSGAETLDVVVTASKTDPAFRGRVRRAIEAALTDSPESAEGEDEAM